MILFTKSGKFVAEKFDLNFSFSLLNDNFNLEAGEYLCLIDPIWNEVASKNDAYKKILIKVYSSKSLTLS